MCWLLIVIYLFTTIIVKTTITTSSINITGTSTPIRTFLLLLLLLLALTAAVGGATVIGRTHNEYSINIILHQMVKPATTAQSSKPPTHWAPLGEYEHIDVCVELSGQV